MNINENEIYYKDEKDGHVYIDENKALACLLADDICFLNVLRTHDNQYTTCVYVIANDIFAWGCADAECISNSDGDEDSEIYALYKLWKENPVYGATKWLCLKRNEQPQNPIKERMIKDGYWDDVLEKLPPNYYWTKIAEENQKRIEKFKKLSAEEQNEIKNALNNKLAGKLAEYPRLLEAINKCGYFFNPESDAEYCFRYCQLLNNL